jgi:signal transduction histidine kinase
MEARDLARTAEQKAQFFSAVSHELRTPLTSLMAFTDILVGDSENTLSDKQKTHLPIMKRNNEQLALAIDDLIDIAALDVQRSQLQMSTFDIGQLVGESVESLCPVAKRTDIDFDINPQGLMALSYGRMQHVFVR